MKKSIKQLMQEVGIKQAEQRLGDWCVWLGEKMFVGRTLRGALEQARQVKVSRK